MKKIMISIAKNFSITPGGRFKKEGEYSGEEFRDTILEPRYIQAVEEHKGLLVDLDGCLGFPSSFIDEGFGGLARKYKGKHIYKIFEFISNDQPGLISEILKIMQDGDK